MSYDLGTAHGKIVLDYDSDKAVDKAEEDIDRLSRASAKTDKDVSKLGKVLGGLGKGVALTGLVAGITNAGVQAAALGIQILGMIPALASLSSLAAALPGLFIAGQIALGVMRAALSGVGDAAKAAFETDPAKFNEALQKLSPAAREAAVALREIVPGLKAVQQGLQENFFQASSLAGFMPRLLGRMQDLSPALNVVAGQFGELTRRVGLFVLSGETLDFVRNAVARLQIAIRNVTPAVFPLLDGLRDVGNVGLPLMDRLSAAVGRVATSFGSWLSEIAADGRLQDWIDTALSTLQTLGNLLGNIGSILNSVFQAAESSGGGFLNTLTEITGQIATFLSSAEGSEAMRSLFSGILEVARQLAPIFTTLAGALAGALGPALKQIATEVGPVLLEVVRALAPAFGPIAMAFADVLTALAPLLPPLAQLVALLATALAGGLSAIAAEIGPVIKAFSGPMSEAIAKLVPLFASLVAQALPLAATFGVELMNALVPLIPHILELATVFADALAPALPQIVAAAQQLLPVILELATVFAESLADGIQRIIPYIPALVGLMVGMTTTMYQILAVGLRVVTWLIQFGAGLLGLPAKIAAFVGSLIGGLVNGVTSAYNGVVSAGGQILTWFSELPGKIGGFLAALPGVIGRFAVQSMQRLAFEVGAGIGRVITFTATFPGKVKAAISSLLSTLGNAGRNAWNAARNAFSNGVNAAINVARTLPGRIKSAISALPGQIVSVARNAWNQLKNAFSNGVNSARSTASSLPGKIRGAVGNLGSLLVGAGRDAVMGLVRGLRNAIGSAVSAAASVGRSVINGIKSTLRISSPSKVMIEFGEWTSEGLAEGILSKIQMIRDAAKKLANTAIAPTLTLSSGASLSRMGSAIASRAARPTQALMEGLGAASGTRTYNIEVDGKVITSLVVDAITGNPIQVAKAADEGSRKQTFFGSGR